MQRKPRSPGAFSFPPGALLLLAVLVLCAHADAFTLGFFADDFHFLDAARREPLWQNTLGWHGIWPWYRPLAREFYFLPLAHAGSAAPELARAIALATLFAGALALVSIGQRFVSRRAGVVAAALFVATGWSKFLIAWASGYQDVLAIALTLGAVALEAGRRRRGALVCAALAPFAKESGFLAFPLAVLAGSLARGARPDRSVLVPYGALAAGAVALHVLARLSWPRGGSAAVIDRSLPGVAGVVIESVRTFLPGTPLPATPWVVVCAVAAALCAGLLAWRAAAARPNRGAAIVLGVAGALFGFLPLVAAQMAEIARPQAYYGFVAVPWIALLLALALDRLPRALSAATDALWVFLLVAANGFRAPDLDRAASWEFRRWDAPEAARLSAVARRLTADLKRELATRPESVIVLFHSLPYGSFFQTGDGPATREALRDPRARAYFAPELPLAPVPPRPERLRVLGFDTATFHLRGQELEVADALRLATRNLSEGRQGAAYGWTAAVAQGSELAPPLAYARFAAVLLAEGPGAYGAALAAAGVDTSATAAEARARAVLPEAPASVVQGFARVFGNPRGAQGHEDLGRILLEHGAAGTAELEFLIALALEPERAGIRDELERLRRVREADPSLPKPAQDVRSRP